MGRTADGRHGHEGEVEGAEVLLVLVCAHAGPHFWDTAKSTTSDAFSACKSNRWCAIPVGTVTGAAAGVALVAAAPVVVGAVVGVGSAGPVAGGAFAAAQAAALWTAHRRARAVRCTPLGAAWRAAPSRALK